METNCTRVQQHLAKGKGLRWSQKGKRGAGTALGSDTASTTGLTLANTVEPRGA